MDISLDILRVQSGAHIQLSGSKSETNRLRLLQAIYPNITITNASDSDDSRVMQQCLSSSSTEKNVGHAGTAMRFLCAYYASTSSAPIVLTGSERMKQRPIGVLVEALRSLGAQIDYLEKEGFPPLRINGKRLTKNRVEIDASVSSQFITALMLIAPSLPNGLHISLKGKITSLPYIQMTQSILEDIGAEVNFERNEISILPLKQAKTELCKVESDWSSASYYYSLVAMSAIGTELTLSSFKPNSRQGDAILAELYKHFGVETSFKDNNLKIVKTTQATNAPFVKDFNKMPDLAQTVLVTCLGLQIPCRLSGLETLHIKETDRMMAMKIELEKFSARVEITNDELALFPQKLPVHKRISIDTYKDHRMALAFAPLAVLQPLLIRNAEVVSKSYPNFWRDLEQKVYLVEIHQK